MFRKIEVLRGTPGTPTNEGPAGLFRFQNYNYFVPVARQWLVHCHWLLLIAFHTAQNRKVNLKGSGTETFALICLLVSLWQRLKIHQDICYRKFYLSTHQGHAIGWSKT